MYASIRKYKTDAPGLIIPLVRNEFLKTIKKLPGFVNYYVISSERDSNEIVTVSIFEDKEGAMASNKLAAEWIKKRDMEKHFIVIPEITSGEVNVTSVEIISPKMKK